MGDAPTIHESLLPADESTFELTAPASVVKPIFAYANALADEVRLHITTDGIEYRLVDPANVAMVELAVPAAAFDQYDVEETVIGVHIDQLRDALRAGRKRQDDEIRLSYNREHLSTTVQREYDGAHMDLQTTVATIDPDSLREDPELQDLEWHAEATVQRDMLRDAVATVNAVSEHITFEHKDDDLHISGKSDTSDASAIIHDGASGENVGSIYSLDYITDMIDGLTTVGAETVDLSLGEEYPIQAEWTTEWNSAEVSGTWFQAPRISE